MPFVSDALQEIHKRILADQIDPKKIKKSTCFGSWFRRSQKYIAFTLSK